jgi:hypothetical protein
MLGLPNVMSDDTRVLVLGEYVDENRKAVFI